MTNNNIIYQVDSFTTTIFKGNPAGVQFVDKEVDELRMQQIAMEMNLSETAFVTPNGNSYDIRFFTPTTEISLCGHATLASAHLMYELGMVYENDIIYFNAKGGNLIVSKGTDGIIMEFPKYDVKKIETPDLFASIISFEPVEVYASGGWIVAVAANETIIKNVKPAFDKMTKNGLGKLLITANSNQKDVDYVVRCFAPASGINEDPVTGSAQCALVPIWNLKTGKTSFTAIQLSERTGILKLELVNDIVKIKGEAITVFKANLK